jgi:hypothetical protein
MNFLIEESILASGLFFGMLLLFEVGRRIGIARGKRDPGSADKGSGPIEAAVFGLLGCFWRLVSHALHRGLKTAGI